MELLAFIEQKRGTATELARLVGVSKTTIHEWSKGKKQTPAERCIQIEKLTKGSVRCEDLRPDVDWSSLRTKRR